MGWETEQEKSVSGPLNATDWELPDEDHHYTDTMNAEELRVKPGTLDLTPTKIQDGNQDWVIEDIPSD